MHNLVQNSPQNFNTPTGTYEQILIFSLAMLTIWFFLIIFSSNRLRLFYLSLWLFVGTMVVMGNLWWLQVQTPVWLRFQNNLQREVLQRYPHGVLMIEDEGPSMMFNGYEDIVVYFHPTTYATAAKSLRWRVNVANGTFYP